MVKEMMVQGIVIDEMAYGESSKIIKVFTLENGIISIMAKGALGFKSKFSMSTNVFSESHMKLSKGNSFYYLLETDLIRSNYELRNNSMSYAVGNYVIGLVKNIMLQEYDDVQIYLLVSKTIAMLSSMKEKQVDLSTAFMLKIASFLGVRPLLRVENNNTTYRFSWEYGGIIPSVANFHGEYNLLYEDEVNYLRTLLFSKLEVINSIEITTLKKYKLHKIMTSYLLERLEIKRFNEIRFLDSLF